MKLTAKDIKWIKDLISSHKEMGSSKTRVFFRVNLTLSEFDKQISIAEFDKLWKEVK